MAPFNPALLATSPTPEPEKCPSSPSKLSSPSMEVEETYPEKAHRVWAGLRESLDTQIKIILDSDPALFSDREAWTCSWSDLHASLSEVALLSTAKGVDLDLDKEGHKQLVEGKRVYKEFMREIHDMKSKAIAEPAPSTPARTRHAQQKMVAEVVLPSMKDVGEKLVMRPDACMSVSKAPSCTRCSTAQVTCGGAPGKRCPPCNKSKKPCSFSCAKATRKVPAGTRRKVESAPAASNTPGSVSGSVLGTVSTPALDVMEINLSESGESEAEGEEVVIRGSRSLPIRTINPLPARTIRSGQDNIPGALTDGADESAGELEQLRAENEHLKSIICGMRQNVRNHQSRLIAFSNQAYAMFQEMSQLDKELLFLD